MKLKHTLAFILLSVAGLALGLDYDKPAQAQTQSYTCAKELTRCGEGDDDSNCNAAAYQSSLIPVTLQETGDWYVPQEDFGVKCGVKYCFPVLPFQCSCGKPRSIRACTSSEKSGS